MAIIIIIISSMASSEETWIVDIINDFIHSSLWLSPIQTFLDANCASFDYDDDDIQSSSVLHEQKLIFNQYRNLVDSLMTSLSEDLKVDLNALNRIWQTKNSIATDDSYEQLYSGNDLHLFTEMMKRKNLILQLQALINLQTEISDDRVLQLVSRASASAPMPDVKVADELTNIDAMPEEVLREKLRELSMVDEGDAAAIVSRQNFLKQQRDLIVKKQRNERVRELEKEIDRTRPQSAAKVARQAMEISSEQPVISDDELEKRRAMAAKLRREVVNKH